MRTTKRWTAPAVALAACLGLGAATDNRVPTYYSHAEYYSSSSYSVQVGGWLSCPPDEGGYSYWGTVTSYAVYTENDYDACGIAAAE